MPNPDTAENEKFWFFVDEGSVTTWLGSCRRGEMYTEQVLEHQVKHLPAPKHRFRKQAPRIISHILRQNNYDGLASKNVLTVVWDKTYLGD
eukprot:TRINITY_DN73221_c0_g1_i1.p1 TRINITY_DN73221_c0_g1~~TRINITY_DN73221_c0_g1_i1.p1  ORF type:complete len:102 (-),score=22.19 TRINITY_DN73221_c0_g1_i1:79-351(-)